MNDKNRFELVYHGWGKKSTHPTAQDTLHGTQ